MVFSESPRVVFKNNPLRDVICQLRFPTILSIGARDPAEFQDRIRDAYPIYERVEGAELPKEMADLLRDIKFAGPDTGVAHNFRSEDGKRLVGLKKDFISVSDAEYTTWGQFKQAIDEAKAALESTYRPAFYARTGLRYLDDIDRKKLGIDGKPWSELIAPEFLGHLGVEGVRERVLQTRNETLIRVDAEGTPPVKCFVTLRHGLLNREDARERQIYRIDADFFTDEHLKGDAISEVLGYFNRLAGQLFRSAITNDLREALLPEPVD